MSKPYNAPDMAGMNPPPGDAPPQYPQDLNHLGHGQSNTPYGQPQVPGPQQQGYVYGQYAGNMPQTHPYGVPTPQPNWSNQNQNAQYPPPVGPNGPPAGPTMVGSSGGGAPSNAGYFGAAPPTGPYGAPMNGAPYGGPQATPYMQNYNPGQPMNHNNYYNGGGPPTQQKASDRATDFCSSCCTSCVAIVAAFACIDCLF